MSATRGGQPLPPRKRPSPTQQQREASAGFEAPLVDSTPEEQRVATFYAEQRALATSTEAQRSTERPLASVVELEPEEGTIKVWM